MTTTNEVKLPELPKALRSVICYISAVGSTHKDPAQDYYNAEQLQAYAKQYGTLCYEAGLEAGRGQALAQPAQAATASSAQGEGNVEAVCALLHACDLLHKAVYELTGYDTANASKISRAIDIIKT